jgi:signal transduction histidine kinase
MKIATPPPVTLVQVPDDLADHLRDLEKWARDNRRDALRETVAFWILKGPAIVASTSAGLLAHFQMPAVSLTLGVLSSVCMLIDSVQPRGLLKSTHTRALHDIRNLTTRMATEWRSRSDHADPLTVARKIIADSEKERNRIATYVRDAEAAMGNLAPKA